MIASQNFDYSPIAFWGSMKEKNKKIINEHDETQAAFEFLSGMFEYEGLPDTVRPEFLERYLLTNGMASIRKDEKGDGEFYAMIADNISAPDPYGMGQKISSSTANGHVYEDDKNSDAVAYGYNNFLHTPAMEAYKIGSYIAEIDTSIDLLIWWSRASRLFIVDDDKQKEMLNSAFSSIKKGVPLSLKSSNILREIEEGKKSIDAMDLTDAGYADKLDKLAYIREKRYDWFKDRYGMSARDTAKKAQVSIDEANGGTGASLIIPLNMLKCRQEFITMCNNKFGWSASVHFGGAWLGEIERYETTIVENGDIDIDGYEAIDERGEEDAAATKTSSEDVESSDKPDGDDAGSGKNQDGAND